MIPASARGEKCHALCPAGAQGPWVTTSRDVLARPWESSGCEALFPGRGGHRAVRRVRAPEAGGGALPKPHQPLPSGSVPSCHTKFRVTPKHSDSGGASRCTFFPALLSGTSCPHTKPLSQAGPSVVENIGLEIRTKHAWGNRSHHTEDTSCSGCLRRRRHRDHKAALSVALRTHY